MLLAKVLGQVVASQREAHLSGFRFQVIQPVDEAGRSLGDLLVALDVVSAGEGDLVMYIDAREAPKALPTGYGAIDACVVGIVDSAV